MEGFLVSCCCCCCCGGNSGDDGCSSIVSAGLTGERGSDRIGSVVSMGRAFKVLFRFSSKRLTNSGLSMIDGVVVNGGCCFCLSKVTELSGSLVICGAAKLNSWGLLVVGFSARPKKYKSCLTSP